MSTVASRRFRSSPYRDTSQTWALIVDLLTKGENTQARKELLSVKGIAASLIADRAMKDAPIIATCEGPRTRIYCLYDDDAVDGSDASEDSLGFDPLKGGWAVSLPCPADELDWVQSALKEHSSRITARDLAAGISTEEQKSSNSALVLDMEAFLKS
jgi:hypothetical protein